MSLLTSKYAVMLFGAMGVAAVLVFIIWSIKTLKNEKSKATSMFGRLKKAAPKAKRNKNPYADVQLNIQKQAKHAFWPSFLCVYEGNMDHALTYLGSLIDLDIFEITLMDTNQSIVVGHGKVIVVITLESTKQLNIPLFNGFLNKLYHRGDIQLPVVLLKATSHEFISSQFAMFQKFMAQMPLFSHGNYQIHLSVADFAMDEEIEALFDLLKHDTKISFEVPSSAEDIKTRLDDVFAVIRHRISTQFSDLNNHTTEVRRALTAAYQIERATLPAIQLVSELTQGAYGQVSAQAIHLNFGIHAKNYHSTFFDFGSKAYKNALKPRHVLVPVTVLVSAFFSTVFAYNAYQQYEFSEFIQLKRPFAPLDTMETAAAAKTYEQWVSFYRSQLLLPFLYNAHGNKTLNRLYANYLYENVLLPKFYQTEDYLHKVIYLSLIASINSSKVADILKDNLSLISLITGLSSEQFSIVYRYGSNNNKLVSHIPNNLYKAESDDYKIIKSASSIASGKMLSAFFDGDYFHATNDQLKEYISRNVITHQEVCLLQQVVPDMLTNEVLNNNSGVSKFLAKLGSALPQDQSYCSGSTALIDLQNLIPATQNHITSFSDMVEQMFHYNDKVNAFFSKRSVDQSKEQVWKRILLSAELNSILVSVLDRNQNTINLLDNSDYYQYTFKTVFSRNVTAVSLVYSKNTLMNIVLPLLKRYESLVKLLQQYNINYGALDRLEKGALTHYASQYVQMLNQVLQNALPTKVSIDNLQMFLIDITSDNTPFSNMLDYIKTNTSFGKGEKLPAELQVIPNNFARLNEFVASQKYQDYKQVLLSISNNLYQLNRENYTRLYEEINSTKEDSLLAKINGLIDALGVPNNEAYQLLKVPESIIRLSVAQYLIIDLKQQWDLDIVPKIALVKSKFPLDLNSSSVMSSDALNDMFGPKGVVYNEMYALLKGFIHLDAISGIWQVDKNLTIEQQKTLVSYVDSFNYFYRLQSDLWAADGKPRAVDMFVAATPFKQVSLDGISKMVLSFMQIGAKDRVLGLDTYDQSNHPVAYDWQLQPTVSIGWLSSSNITYQKTYQGEWAVFKMLADAHCNRDWLCSWKISSDNSKVAPFVVSFQLKSDILNLVKYQQDNSADNFQA
ncbi:hypothetical protein [Cysteiniphilum halobium]|uniref:hypothetical protein n=1 Tax=Cysteiniphilum halobium TaxID=2219059 RepID=UPI003F861F28